MNWLRTILLRFRALFHKRKLDVEMDEEMRAHVEMQTQENLQAGMEPGEARRAALRQFGRVESIKETCREQRGLVWLEHLAQDVRYAGRLLRKNPGFTAVVALTLALGIGASTAVFSVLDTVLFHPVPGPEPARLIEIGERSHGNKDEPRFGGLTSPAIEILKTRREFFSEVVWYSSLWIERATADFIICGHSHSLVETSTASVGGSWFARVRSSMCARTLHAKLVARIRPVLPILIAAG